MNAASIAPSVAIRRPDDRRPGRSAASPPHAPAVASITPVASTTPVATDAPVAKPSGPMIYTVEKGANVVPWIGGR